MAIEINLLPKDKEVSKKSQRISGIANKIALVFTVISLAVVSIGGATFYFLNQRLDALKAEKETYENSILSLQSTEAGLILLKDRLQKTENILAARSVESAFEKQQAIISYSPSSVEIEKSDVDVSGSTLKIVVPESQDLLALLSRLQANPDYQSLVIKEFTFDGQNGYSLEMNIF